MSQILETGGGGGWEAQKAKMWPGGCYSAFHWKLRYDSWASQGFAAAQNRRALDKPTRHTLKKLAEWQGMNRRRQKKKFSA
jgi:hypothetical protein